MLAWIGLKPYHCYVGKRVEKGGCALLGSWWETSYRTFFAGAVRKPHLS